MRYVRYCFEDYPEETHRIKDEDEEEEDEAANQLARDLMWLQMNSGKEKHEEIHRRMRETLRHRRSLLRNGDDSGKPVTAADIIAKYDRFKDTPGLVNQDFVALFPDKDNCLIENWSLISEKTIELAKERAAYNNAPGRSLTACLLKIEERQQNATTFDDLILHLLVIMLPPTAFGTEKGVKISAEKAFPMLLNFEKDNIDVALTLRNRADVLKTRRSPYLMLLGNAGSSTSNFLVVDHLGLETSSSLVKALDDLFKVHYVFGLEYQVQLRNFFLLVQTGIFRIDTADCTSTTVLEFRKNFDFIFRS